MKILLKFLASNLLFFGTFVWILVSCSSLRHSFESDIRLGMEKAEVLDILGGPQLTKRRNNEDIWHYYFYSGNTKIVKELRFKNNRVSYKGNPQIPKPSESAAAIDRRNSRLPPSFSSSETVQESLTPKQKQEYLEKYIQDDEEVQAKRPKFKEL